MADGMHDTTARSWVAIDIAKDWNVVMVEIASGKRRSFKVVNRASDHNWLVDYVRGLPGRVRAALEATGDYHRPSAHLLKTEGFEVVELDRS